MVIQWQVQLQSAANRSFANHRLRPTGGKKWVYSPIVSPFLYTTADHHPAAANPIEFSPKIVFSYRTVRAHAGKMRISKNHSLPPQILLLDPKSFA